MALIDAENIIKTYNTGTGEDCTFYALKGVSLKIEKVNLQPLWELQAPVNQPL